MNCTEVDAFFATPGKRVIADYNWPDDGPRLDDFRSRQPIEIAGRLSPVSIEIKARMLEPAYVIIVLLAPQCITRLCLGTGHVDRRTRERVFAGHLHTWHDNRPKGAKPTGSLPHYRLIPSDITTRSTAFAWFMAEYGIESPAINWPDGRG